MAVLDSITVSEDISLIYLTSAPADMCFVASLFEALTRAGINVDMISQNPPQGSEAALSFTIADADLGEALEVLAEMREVYPELRTSVSSGNSKLLVSGEQMRNSPGVAAKVFHAAAVSNADIRMITTSEIDISLLVTKSDAGLAEAKIHELFEI